MNRTRIAHTAARAARLLLLLAFLPCALPAFGQGTLTYRFDNVQNTGNGLAFDVVAVSDDAGARLGDMQVYLDYDEAFGTFAHADSRLTATLGSSLAGLYGAPIVNDNAQRRASLVAAFTGTPEQGYAPAGAPVVLFHVTLQAVASSDAARVSFHESLMEGQQYTSDLATAFGDVRATDLVETALTLDVQPSLRAATAGDGAVALHWSSAATRAPKTYELEHAAGPDQPFQRVGVVESADVLEKEEGYSYLLDGLEMGTHRFRLRQVAEDGTVSFSQEVTLRVEMAERFLLDPAYPNPFNPTATFRFAVREAEQVRAVLYNALGQQVKVLYDGVPAASTYQTVRIDGSSLSSGLYFIILRGASFSATQRVLLMK